MHSIERRRVWWQLYKYILTSITKDLIKPIQAIQSAFSQDYAAVEGLKQDA